MNRNHLLGLCFILSLSVTQSWATNEVDFLDQPHHKFDSALWKQAGVRVTMVNDLVHRYKIIGMSRVQIRELLGNPCPIESSDKLGSSSTSDSYGLTNPKCGNAPVTYLNINYDDMGEVISFALRTRTLEPEPLGVTNAFGKMITSNF